MELSNYSPVSNIQVLDRMPKCMIANQLQSFLIIYTHFNLASGLVMERKLPWTPWFDDTGCSF